MDMHVEVSVVMCTYNGAKYLKEQLDTILAQTYPLYEILIFDDCSTDETLNLLDNYAANNHIIKIFKNEKNIGFAKNFKQAILAASGDVIATADQDDVWNHHKIERMLLNWNDASLLIYCNSIRFENNVPINASANPGYRRFEGKDARNIFLFNTISGHALLIKKELLSIAFPFASSIYYDWWFAVNAAYNGGVSYLDEILVYQRVHSNNVSIDHSKVSSKKLQKSLYKQRVITHLKEFQKAANIKPTHIIFIKQFVALLEKSFKQKFNLPLFVFILKHGKYMFFHKKRRIKIFSNLKHALEFVSN